MSIAEISRKLRRYQREISVVLKEVGENNSIELTTAALISRYLKNLVVGWPGQDIEVVIVHGLFLLHLLTIMSGPD